MGFPNRILVAIDGSPPSQSALEKAGELARQCSATLTIVAVAPESHIYYGSVRRVETVVNPGARRWASRILKDAEQSLRGAGLSNVTVIRKEGDVVEELLALIEEKKPDLVVLGSRGLSGARRLFLGSVSESIVHRARIPTLVIRGRNPPKAQQ